MSASDASSNSELFIMAPSGKFMNNPPSLISFTELTIPFLMNKL